MGAGVGEGVGAGVEHATSNTTRPPPSLSWARDTNILVPERVSAAIVPLTPSWSNVPLSRRIAVE